MIICYLPIFLAFASFHVPDTQAQHMRVVRQLDSELSALMVNIMSLIMPSEVAGVFTESFQQVFSNAPVDFSALGSLVTLGRKRRSTTLEAQLKRIRNEVDTFERMIEGTSAAPLHSAVASRIRRASDEGENSDGSSDPQGKAVEVAQKGAEMAGNGMESAKQGTKKASDGAQGAKSGAHALGSGAEMMGKGAEVMGAGIDKGKEAASGFSG